MQDIRGQDKTDETRQYRTGIPASAASNVSDDFAGHLAGARHTDARHKRSGTGWKTQDIWKTRQRTIHDTTKQYSPPRMHRMLRKSKTMEDKTGQNTTHYTSRNRRDPGLGYSECFRKASDETL